MDAPGLARRRVLPCELMGAGARLDRHEEEAAALLVDGFLGEVAAEGGILDLVAARLAGSREPMVPQIDAVPDAWSAERAEDRGQRPAVWPDHAS